MPDLPPCSAVTAFCDNSGGASSLNYSFPNPSNFYDESKQHVSDLRKSSRPGAASLGATSAPRHVSIRIEGTESAKAAAHHSPFAPDVKGKGKERTTVELVGIERHAEINVAEMEGEAMDFDALCDGMDWELPISSAPAPRTVVVDRIPHSRRFTRCIVRSVEEGVSDSTGRPIKILKVKLQGVEDLRAVLLCDDWVATPVEMGDTINVGGFFPSPTLSSPNPSLSVTLSESFLILHPDILVSSTKVSDSSHCTRKALLQELIRSSGASTPSLLYGNMLHGLMQGCFVDNEWGPEEMEKRVTELVRRELGELWGMRVEVEEAKRVMMEKSGALEVFKTTFVGSTPGPSSFLCDPRTKDSSRARFSVAQTLQVEEDIWSPQYGLKGKVDVSVAGRILEGDGSGVQGAIEPATMKTLPFEIKTGRTNAGREHRAQTMLYTLLMSDRYDEAIDSGLLYYSQTNDVFRVTAARNEIRGLLLARNNFATYLHRHMTLSASFGTREAGEAMEEVASNVEGGGTKVLTEEEKGELLPAPIDDPRSCKWCYVSDACMLYRSAVEGADCVTLDPDSSEWPIQIQFEEKTGHLTAEQKLFFKTWEKLISLEEQELVRFKKEIWTMGGEERMKLGRCLANMSIDDTFDPPLAVAGFKMHRFTYRLHRATSLTTHAPAAQRAAKSLLGGNISINDPVVLSLENPQVLGLSRGFVLAITTQSITLGLDHPLTDNPQAARVFPEARPHDLMFRIDKDELAAGMGRIRNNLVQLFVAGGDERRRELVVDLKKPEFFEVIRDKGKIIPSDLNEDQLNAVEKALSAKDYALILGMPGTGKTTTIAHILRALANAGKTVLLTSYTHSAVDNILLKVQDAGLSVLRLGNRDKIMPMLHKYTLDPDSPASTLAQLDRQLMEPQIVATTCLGINEPIFTRRQFDVCIVDEASQVTLPTCLGPLRYAKTFVLVGDHHQLPPLVRNRDAREGGLDVSLFKRLSDAHPEAIVYLSHQYRMNSDIMLLSNKLVYFGKLRAGSDEVAARQLVLPEREELECTRRQHTEGCWLQDLLDDNRKVIFVDTDRLPARERKVGSLVDNEIEAKLVTQTVEALVQSGVPTTSVGVIALYRHQIKLLTRKLEHLPSVEVLTADRSQGRDKEVIIMSLTRSNDSRQTGDLVQDWRRINVCLTRAKSKLVVFGSKETLKGVDVLGKFFGVVEENGWIYELPKGAEGAHEGKESPAAKRMRQIVIRSPSQEGEGRKRVRIGGPEARGFRNPLVKDIANSLS